MEESSNDIYHHGILGMRWGIRRFQPYLHGKHGKEVGEAAKVKSRRKSVAAKWREKQKTKAKNIAAKEQITKAKTKSNKAKLDEYRSKQELKKAKSADKESRKPTKDTRKPEYRNSLADAVLRGKNRKANKIRPGMSDAEIRKAINRIKLENELTSVSNTKKTLALDRLTRFTGYATNAAKLTSSAITIYNNLASTSNTIRGTEYKLIKSPNNSNRITGGRRADSSSSGSSSSSSDSGSSSSSSGSSSSSSDSGSSSSSSGSRPRRRMHIRHSYEGNDTMNNELMHYGVKGMKRGIRKYTNPDGTLNAAGRARYLSGSSHGSNASFATDYAIRKLRRKKDLADSRRKEEAYRKRTGRTPEDTRREGQIIQKRREHAEATARSARRDALAKATSKMAYNSKKSMSKASVNSAKSNAIREKVRSSIKDAKMKSSAKAASNEARIEKRQAPYRKAMERLKEITGKESGRVMTSMSRRKKLSPFEKAIREQKRLKNQAVARHLEKMQNFAGKHKKKGNFTQMRKMAKNKMREINYKQKTDPNYYIRKAEQSGTKKKKKWF
jgi:hypothetical protein